MATNSISISDIISRIERAPNVARLIALVDQALGSSAIAIDRVGARWQVSEDGVAIYETDFATMRRRLASYVTDAHTCDEDVEVAAPAMIQQQCQQQQACAAPGANNSQPLSPPAGLPTRGWTDDEILGVIGPLLDDVEEAAVASFDERLRDAAASAVSATRAWLALHERESAGEHIPYNTAFDARERLQDTHRAHADMQAIVAIGYIGDDRTLWSHHDGLAVYTDGDADPFLILPRGLDRETVRLVLRTYDRAYDVGKAHGRYEIQAGLRNLLNVAAA